MSGPTPQAQPRSVLSLTQTTEFVLEKWRTAEVWNKLYRLLVRRQTLTQHRAALTTVEECREVRVAKYNYSHVQRCSQFS